MHSQRVGVSIHDAPQEAEIGFPWVFVASQRTLNFSEVGLLTQFTQCRQQVLLAAVPTVERTDADPGALGDLRDGGLGVEDEHGAGRRQDRCIVAFRLGKSSPTYLLRPLGHESILVPKTQ